MFRPSRSLSSAIVLARGRRGRTVGRIELHTYATIGGAVTKRQVLVLCVLLLPLVQCVGGPGNITLPPPLPADILAVGTLTQSGCDGVNCASATFNVRNTGVGCALTTDMAGTVALYRRDGNLDVKVTEASWELSPDDKSAGMFRPGETRRAVAGPMLRNPGDRTYRITVRQTAVACT